MAPDWSKLAQERQFVADVSVEVQPSVVEFAERRQPAERFVVPLRVEGFVVAVRSAVVARTVNS